MERPSSLEGDAQAACVGYDLAVEVAALAMRFISLMPNLAATGLGLLLFPRGGELFPARSEAEDFVLAAMALIPAAAAARRRFTPTGGELVMVHFMDTMVLSGRLRFEKGRRGFRDELLRSWNAPAVVDALRACGALQYGRLTCSIADQQHAARQRADVAAHGLLVCALPGCEKKETTVREFKVCSFRPLFLFLFSCVVSYASRGVFRLPGGGVLQRGAWNAALDAAPQARVQGSQRSRRKTGARSVIQRHVQPH